MRIHVLGLVGAAMLAPAAFAQSDTAVPPANSAAPQAGETSDRTPDKTTQTPQNQQDTAGGKTSDRSQDKNVKVEHQPGAAGSAGSSSSEGAASGTDGKAMDAPATPDSSSK